MTYTVCTYVSMDAKTVHFVPSVCVCVCVCALMWYKLWSEEGCKDAASGHLEGLGGRH